MEDSTRYNDQRMAAVGTGPFKASTQNKTVRSLDMMIPAVDQCLGTSAGHWGGGGGGGGDGTGPFIMQVMGIGY